MNKTNAPRTIVLIDGFDDGHHLTYLRNYGRALLEQGHRVYEFLPDPARVQPWFDAHCAEHLERLHLVAFTHPEIESPSWRLRHVLKPIVTWRRVAACMRQALDVQTLREVDLVYFLWLDDYIVSTAALVPYLLPVIFPFRWTGLFFHPWHLRISEGESRWASVAGERMLCARNCVCASVLDHGIAGQLAQQVGRPVIAFPDVTEEAVAPEPSAVVARIRERSDGRKVVGLLGNLSKRKGVGTLLKAASQDVDGGWLYVFVGAFDESQRSTFDADVLALLDEAIAGRMANVLVVPERIEDETEFNAIVAMCDVLYAVYELFAHSSGIVTKAGVFRKPVLVSRGFYMQEVVESYRLGLAIDSGSVSQVAAALAILGDADAFRREVGAPDYDGFMGAHGIQALRPALSLVLGCLK